MGGDANPIHFLYESVIAHTAEGVRRARSWTWSGPCHPPPKKTVWSLSPPPPKKPLSEKNETPENLRLGEHKSLLFIVLF
jgi:hypothetical protein